VSPYFDVDGCKTDRKVKGELDGLDGRFVPLAQKEQAGEGTPMVAIQKEKTAGISILSSVLNAILCSVLWLAYLLLDLGELEADEYSPTVTLC
jgi:hypothetical protein